MTGADPRLERMRSLLAVLSASEPAPPDTAGDEAWAAWMGRVGADGDLAGLLDSAIADRRYGARELDPYRAASESQGSRLDVGSVAEAYRLLARSSSRS